MPPFTVERQQQDHTIRILVRGELDLETGPRLRDELRRAQSDRPPVLVLDLPDVTDRLQLQE